MDVLTLLGLLITVVIVGLFTIIGKMWTRLDRMDKRLTAAEAAIYETQQVCNLVSIAYESLRLLAVEAVRYLRQACKQLKTAEPDVVAAIENKPGLEALLTDAQAKAREASKRRAG